MSWQHCFDYNTTSARLSVLGATSAAQKSGEKSSPSHEKTFNQETSTKLNTSQLSHHYDTCTSLPSQPSPYLLQPTLDGKSDKTLQQWGTKLTTSQDKTKAHNLVLTSQPDSAASSDNLQQDATSSTRDSDYRARATSHSSSSCKKPCKSGLHAQSPEEHSMMWNIVLTFLIGGEKRHVRHPRTFLASDQRQRTRSDTIYSPQMARSSLVQDLPRLQPKRPSGSSNGLLHHKLA